jgi:hypothetical protein
MLFLLFYTKDSFLFSNWMKLSFKKINFFKYKFFFYFLKYTIFNIYFNIFKEFNIYGFKINIKGKLGVMGNARKRLYMVKFGKVSNFSIKYKISFNLSLIKTFTGVMGLKL